MSGSGEIPRQCQDCNPRGCYAATLSNERRVGLLLTQLKLGVLTVLLRKPAGVASTHVAVGALVLMTTFVLAARAIRLHRPRRQAESQVPAL